MAAGLAFPHAAQAIQIVRRRRPLNSKKWSAETVYAITSLTATQARPAELAAIIRGHWLIEDRLHWVRDVTYDEDRSQVRTANGPRVMASLRNLAIAILRLTGQTSIAAALRLPRPPARPATANDHELLTDDFAGALTHLLPIPTPSNSRGSPCRFGPGAPGPQVAEWAGHSVEVLYRTYAHCIDGDDERWHKQMEDFLG